MCTQSKNYVSGIVSEFRVNGAPVIDKMSSTSKNYSRLWNSCRLSNFRKINEGGQLIIE